MILITAGLGAFTHINLKACKRSAGSFSVELPPATSGSELHVFISFRQPHHANQKAVVSNSQYVHVQIPGPS